MKLSRDLNPFLCNSGTASMKNLPDITWAVVQKPINANPRFTLQSLIWSVNLGLTSFFSGKSEHYFVRIVIFSLEKQLLLYFLFNPGLYLPHLRTTQPRFIMVLELGRVECNLVWNRKHYFKMEQCRVNSILSHRH